MIKKVLPISTLQVSYNQFIYYCTLILMQISFSESIMHYKPYTFSKNRKVPNGNPTIISQTDREMGQRRNIEKVDKH